MLTGEKDNTRLRKVGSPFKRIAGWIAALVAAIVCVPASGQSMHSTTALANGAAASSQYAGSTLWLSRDVSGFGTQYLSAVRMGSNWGIAPAHAFDVGSNFQIGNGSNWMTDRGLERSITSFVTHPLAVPNTFVGTEVDLAVFFWGTALPGTDLTIAPTVLNELLSYDGFGRPATAGGGNLPLDGQRRLFQTYADAFGFGIASPDYVAGIFSSPSSLNFLALGGTGTFGSSGSGVYNQSGNITALAVAQSGGTGYLSTTFSLRLSLYEPWINTVVPSPGSAALLMLGSIFATRRRRG